MTFQNMTDGLFLNALPVLRSRQVFFERSLGLHQGISWLRAEQGLIMELVFTRGSTRDSLVNEEQGFNMEVFNLNPP